MIDFNTDEIKNHSKNMPAVIFFDFFILMVSNRYRVMIWHSTYKHEREKNTPIPPIRTDKISTHFQWYSKCHLYCEIWVRNKYMTIDVYSSLLSNSRSYYDIFLQLHKV